MDAFSAIIERVEQKREDYASYDFEKAEMAALNTFFDLAQEYDSLENLYMVSVTVPRVFFGLQSNLYVIEPKGDAIKWVASSHRGPNDTEDRAPHYIKVTDAPYTHGHVYVVPIPGRKTPASRILFETSGDVIGIFEVTQADHLTEGQLFFVQKYVNRIGYNLYNKLLSDQNIQHLKFINNLVADIEHNVIVPNLRYKYYFGKIRKYLNISKEIETDLDNFLDEVKSHRPDLYAKISEVQEGLVVINRAIFKDQEEIEKHYKHSSLFLESLFRPDHFLYGEYILKKSLCYLWKDIIVPQLGRHRGRFSQQDVVVNYTRDDDKASEDIQVKVDKGLMAQVFANLFSNAVKYTESVVDDSGNRVKKMDCTTSVIKDFFGSGHHGVRFGISTSGRSIDKEDGARIFDEGFRLGRQGSMEGTGHGLHFVKNVVEVHGGIVGHKAEDQENEFYFIIPL